ncbi:hypothetical protein DFS33DRAFT_30182 [Desarmillaria ectypa]|nr:hypothetical protein DFS33DRAFT_30182 [Desarmillaria ectypa]
MRIRRASQLLSPLFWTLKRLGLSTMLLLLSFQLVFLFFQCSAEGIEVFGTITSSSTVTATPATSLSSGCRRRWILISMFCAAAVLSQVIATTLHLRCQARELDMENDSIKIGKNLDEGKCAEG